MGQQWVLEEKVTDMKALRCQAFISKDLKEGSRAWTHRMSYTSLGNRKGVSWEMTLGIED